MATLSTPEAELGGAIPGIKFGIGIKDLVTQINDPDHVGSGFDLFGDNTAAVITITQEITHWRTRHYAIQAGWARDQVGAQSIKVSHIRGINLPADGLTKILQGTAIRKARILLTLRNGTESKEDLGVLRHVWALQNLLAADLISSEEVNHGSVSPGELHPYE